MSDNAGAKDSIAEAGTIENKDKTTTVLKIKDNIKYS
jgi:hypothetical protein